jgi:hypothetical protein
MFNSRSILLLLLVLTISVISVSCTLCNDGYKQYRLEKGIAHFSFEYPCSYDKSGSEINNDDGFTHIMLQGPYHKDVEDFTLISIFVIDSDDPDFLKPERRLNNAISLYETFLDYRLIERSSVNVAGIEGQQILYFYNKERPEIGDAGYIPGAGPAPTIARDIYFSDEGYLWNITIFSNESTAKADMADFEHMLETFTILN